MERFVKKDDMFRWVFLLAIAIGIAPSFAQEMTTDTTSTAVPSQDVEATDSTLVDSMQSVTQDTVPIIRPSGVTIAAEGELEDSTVWTQGAEVTITGEVIVPRNGTLVIEPGVMVYMLPGAVLNVDGTLIARGRDDVQNGMIRFQPATDGERWGRILFNSRSQSEVDEDGNYISGSIFENVIVEGGGAFAAGFHEGSVTINGGSPFIYKVTIRHGESQNGGGIALINGATSIVKACNIINNTAYGNGGGIYASLNADVTLVENLVLGNQAERDGGGVYMSFSPARLMRSVVEENEAGRDGGALALNGSTPVVRNNVFRHNVATNEGANIILRSGTPDIRYNSFITGEGRRGITTQPASGAGSDIVNAARNYWGTSENILLDRKKFDREMDPRRPLVSMTPVLEGPPDSAALHPVEVESFTIFEDPAYTIEMPTDYVGFQSYLHLELIGQGNHPEVINWALVDFVSDRGDSLRFYMRETEPNSGVFRARVITDEMSRADDRILRSRAGDHVRIKPVWFEDQTLSYPVQLQQPFVREMEMLDILDLTHVIDDDPFVRWSYVEPRNRTQAMLRMTVLASDSTVYWTSGEIRDSIPEFRYTGPPFLPGESFVMQMEVFNNLAWSDPVQIPFRRNSVPEAPLFEYPLANEILLTQTPVFHAHSELDREGDSLWTTFEIAYESDPSSLIFASDPLPVDSDSVKWWPSDPLTDNAIYLVRARTTDSLEVSEDSEWLRFTVNLFNDIPGDYAITSPEWYGELMPADEITWSEPYDPDPEDTLTYRIQFGPASGITRDRGFIVSALDNIVALEDDQQYSLTVEVRDRLGARVVAADSAMKVYYNAENDIPTIPVGFTLTDSQRVREYPVRLAWDPSTDEDHSDPSLSIVYEVELTREDGSSIAVLQSDPGVTALDLTPVPDNSRAVWRVRAIDDESAASQWSQAGILEVNIQDEPPLDFALGTPEDGAVPFSLGPTEFTWDGAVDPDPLNTITYTFYLATSPEFDEMSLISIQETGEASSTVFEDDLEHLVDYYWRVKATDNTGLSTFSDTFTFRVISTPTAPTWSAALPFEVGPDYSVRWIDSSDPDPRDVLEYRVEISADDSFASDETAVADPVRSTSVTLNSIEGIRDVLTDDGMLMVRVKARDDQGFEGEWSEVRQTYINFQNDAPEAPEPLSPMDQRLTEDRPTFRWREADDEDHTDSTSTLRYIVRVSRADNPQVAVANGLDTLDATLQWRPRRGLPDNSELLWEVCTLDDDGAMSPWCDPVSFSIDRRQEAPERFELIGPGEEEVIAPNSPITFRWQEAVDPDLDAVLLYTVELSGDIEQQYGPLEETEYTLSGGLPTGRYRWRVTVTDNNQMSTTSRAIRITVGTP